MSGLLSLPVAVYATCALWSASSTADDAAGKKVGTTVLGELIDDNPLVQRYVMYESVRHSGSRLKKGVKMWWWNVPRHLHVLLLVLLLLLLLGHHRLILLQMLTTAL